LFINRLLDYPVDITSAALEALANVELEDDIPTLQGTPFGVHMSNIGMIVDGFRSVESVLAQRQSWLVAFNPYMLPEEQPVFVKNADPTVRQIIVEICCDGLCWFDTSFGTIVSLRREGTARYLAR
jgi:hypothetical protein